MKLVILIILYGITLILVSKLLLTVLLCLTQIKINVVNAQMVLVYERKDIIVLSQLIIVKFLIKLMHQNVKNVKIIFSYEILNA